MSFNTVAQIITQQATRQEAGLNLYFAAAGGDVLATIAALDENGYPGTVLAERRLLQAEIKTDGSPTAAVFELPVVLQAGTRYAICASCADDATALQSAQVGQPNAAGGLVTQAQAAVGALMRINQLGVVTVYDTSMLRFDMLTVAYTTQQKNIVLGTQAVQDATALFVQAGSNQPEAGASISYTLDLIAGGSTVASHEVDADQPVRLDAPFTGDVRVSATLRVGAAGLGAVLEPGTMLGVGVLHTSGTYITPAITTGGGTDLRVIYDGDIPAGSGVAVHVQADGSEDWRPVAIDSSSNAAGVLEITHRLENVAGAAQRLRLTLSGSTTARPKVTNLRAAFLG